MTNQSILNIIGRPAAGEQLAEECVEMSHAAMKYARILRGDSPTPVTLEETWSRLSEELCDVLVCADVLGLMPDVGMMYEKRQRWIKRLTDGG